MSNISTMFKKNISQELLDDVYNKNYYWYLEHKEFVNNCLKYVSDSIDKLGKNLSILDIGCGHAQLLEVLDDSHYYFGFDLSLNAINDCNKMWNKRNADFVKCNIEQFTENYKELRLDVVLFGNCLVYIKNEHIIDFVDEFVECVKSKYFVVYDLKRTKTANISNRYKMIDNKDFYVNLDGIKEVKKHRKVEVYEI